MTHGINLARGAADKVIFMADGVIEETGTPDEVFGNPKSEKTKGFSGKILGRSEAGDRKQEAGFEPLKLC